MDGGNVFAGTDFSMRRVRDRQDELSVVMLFNKLQGREDIADIRSIPSEEFQRILADTPPYLLDLMAKLVRSFLTQMDIPEKDAEQTVAYIKEGAMGKLFANVEPIHVYYERKMAEKLAEKDALAATGADLTNMRQSCYCHAPFCTPKIRADSEESAHDVR